jgi:hypothetical protein
VILVPARAIERFGCTQLRHGFLESTPPPMIVHPEFVAPLMQETQKVKAFSPQQRTGAKTVLAPAPAAVMLADAGAPAVLVLAHDAVMLADAGAPAVLADAPAAVMLADAGAPAVLADAPAAVMLADAGAPAVLALAPVAVVLALLAPPLLCARPLPLCPPFRPGANGFLITVL